MPGSSKRGAAGSTPNSIRDYFFAMAIASCRITELDEEGKFLFTPDEIAKRARAVSEACLRERAE